MKIRMIALAVATIDLWVMVIFPQEQLIDTSVWIAIVAGVVGVLTLLIQTYGQIQIAKINKKAEIIKKKQDDQIIASAGRDGKIQEVHDLVNSNQSRLTDDMKKMLAELSVLKGEKAEREKADEATKNRLIGASEAHMASTPSTPVTEEESKPA